MGSYRAPDSQQAEPHGGAGPSLAAMWVLLGAGFAAIAVYMALPPGPGASHVYESIGATSAAAVLWARHRYRPAHDRAWMLIAASLFLMVLGDVTWDVYEYGLKLYPEGSLADVFYLATYPFLAAGVLVLVRARTQIRDREALVDAAIFAFGIGLVVWQLVMRPGISDPRMSTFGVVATLAYPLMDVLVVAVALRLLLVPGSRVPSFWLLLAGLCLTLIGDELFAMNVESHLLDPLWLGSYVLLGAAALHPSMTSLTEPAPGRHPALGLLRLLLLVVGLMSAIAVLVPGHPDSTAIYLTGILALVVLARVAFIGRAADRTLRDQRAAEASLREAEALFHALVERIPAVTYIEAPDFDIIEGDPQVASRVSYVSPQLPDIFGISVDEWMKEPGLWRDKLHPDDRDRVLAITDEAAASGTPYKTEYRVVPRPGDIRWVRDESFLVRDDEGRPFAWQGITYDITEEKAAQQAVVAREVADRANEDKSRFLSRTSHELRTPLNAILGFGQLLEMESLPPSQTASLEHILAGGRHLLAMVDDLLEISDIDSAQRKLSLGPVALEPLVADVFDLMASAAADAGVRLHKDAASPAGVCVTAHEQSLRQVLLGLVSNGIKFNRPQGEVGVGWTRREGESIRLTVSDTGIGIPEDKMGQLWAPFERLGAEEAGIPGTGLGLTLALRLVEAMGSSLAVESVVGVGSTFSFDLPMTELPADREVAVPEPG